MILHVLYVLYTTYMLYALNVRYTMTVMYVLHSMCALYVWQVELDDSGNRKAADVSFWLMEAATFDGVSYLTGTEAARYACATGKVEVR